MDMAVVFEWFGQIRAAEQAHEPRQREDLDQMGRVVGARRNRELRFQFGSRPRTRVRVARTMPIRTGKPTCQERSARTVVWRGFGNLKFRNTRVRARSLLKSRGSRPVRLLQSMLMPVQIATRAIAPTPSPN